MEELRLGMQSYEGEKTSLQTVISSQEKQVADLLIKVFTFGRKIYQRMSETVSILIPLVIKLKILMNEAKENAIVNEL
jgi:hypothetical protein